LKKEKKKRGRGGEKKYHPRIWIFLVFPGKTLREGEEIPMEEKSKKKKTTGQIRASTLACQYPWRQSPHLG